MDSLSERLRKLGIQVGADDLKPVERTYPLNQVIPGDVLQMPSGEAYVVQTRMPIGSIHGRYPLRWADSLASVSAWAGYEDLSSLDPQEFAFLDTETTGLSGGAGTLVFQVGAAKFETDDVVVAQFFLREPSEEPAMLEALEGYLNGVKCLVTFNGKSFDLPLLQNRYITNGWETPWSPEAHIDLLHLARKLWKERLPSRALGDLEKEILGVRRTEEEVPGWLVPLIYVDYLRLRDARPLKGVFYHNLIDVLSMIALLDLCARLLDDGSTAEGADPVDLISMGRLWEDTGEMERAIQLYEYGLTRSLPASVYLKAVRQLSFIRKREGDFDAALRLWEVAAGEGEIYACVEIAKYHEHSLKDFSTALEWTRSAMKMTAEKDFSTEKIARLLDELGLREARVLRKLENRKP